MLENHAVLIGTTVNLIGLLTILYRVGLWVGNLNSTVHILDESVRAIRNEMEALKAEIKPRMNDLIRLEQALEATVKAVNSLQDIIRGTFADRLTQCEKEIVELKTICRACNDRAKRTTDK